MAGVDPVNNFNMFRGRKLGEKRDADDSGLVTTTRAEIPDNRIRLKKRPTMFEDRQANFSDSGDVGNDSVSSVD